MPLWGKVNQAADAPKNGVDDKSTKGVDAFDVSVFGVDVSDASALEGSTHTGWIRRVLGTGPVESIAITAGGTLYANTDTFTVTSVGGVNATGTIGTDAGGVITSVAIVEDGSGFKGTETVTITTATGSGATLTASFGGRVGRLSNEVLVAGGITQP